MSDSRRLDFSLPQADGATRLLNDPLARLRIVVGDITRPDPEWKIDTLVNAANESLLGGGGVDGAVHRVAGPKLLEHNRTLGGCPTGLAKATPAFDLNQFGVNHLIHTVGPVWAESDPANPQYAMPGAPLGEAAQLGYLREDTLLASCYHHVLRLAVQLGSQRVAIPAISTGVYRFPKVRAAKIALGHVFGHFAQRPAPELPRMVYFVCFNQADAQVYRDTLERRAEWMTNRRRV